MRLVDHRRTFRHSVMLLAAASLLVACSSPVSVDETPEGSGDGVVDGGGIEEYWGQDYRVIELEPVVAGFDASKTDVVWRLGRATARTITVESGCNEITAYEIAPSELSKIQSEIEQTSVEYPEPIASIENLTKIILRGPSELVPDPSEPGHLSIVSDGATVKLASLAQDN